MERGYMGVAKGAIACASAALIFGCGAVVPRVEYVGGAETEAPAIQPLALRAAAEAVPNDERVAELAAQYYGVEAKVEGLVTDVELLDQGQTDMQMSLRAVESRLGSAENAIVALADKVLARFDSFESQITGLRDALEQRTAPPTVAAPAAVASPVMKPTAEVMSAVRDWSVAWQNGAVTEYMDWYHPHAAITRVSVVSSGAGAKSALGADALRARMERLRARDTRVAVDIANVQVTADGDRMVARFRQDFTAWTGDPKAKPSYVDTGTKTLVFVRFGGEWRVVEESWTPTI